MTTHAQKRAKERYDVELSKNDINKMSSRITRGYRNRVKWIQQNCFEITYKGVLFYVAYDHKTKWITTFLPIDLEDEE